MSDWFTSLPVYQPPKGYDVWMAKVDAALVKLCGRDSRDLPNFGYADAFEHRCTPAAVAQKALKAANDW